MKRSSKHTSLTSVNFSPVGGLNLAVPPQSVGETDLTVAHNMLYLPGNGILSTRPAFECITDTPLSGGPSILNMLQYGTTLICSASDSKLYEWDGTNWALIVALKANSIASMIVFNDLVIFVDGDGIYSWNGTATATLESTIKPTAIVEISNRVAVNDSADADAVYFSGPEDETDWDTSSGGAIGLRAGYGDGMEVNALAVLGADLIVSKKGLSAKFLYRVNTAGMPTNWAAYKIVTDSSAANALSMVGLPNNVMYFTDKGELRGVAGVQEYGDISEISPGIKIDYALTKLVDAGLTPSMLHYSPSYDVLMCIIEGRIYPYQHSTKRFTYIDMLEAGVILSSSCDFGDRPYFGGDNGRLYAFDTTRTSDEPTPTAEENFTSIARSKQYIVPGEAIIRRTDTLIMAIEEGTALVELVGLTEAVILSNIELESSIKYLFDATGYLYDANDALADGDRDNYVVTSRRRTRQRAFSLQMRTLSGRCGLSSVGMSMAMVNG